MHTRSFRSITIMADKQRKCAVCSTDMLPWDNHLACIKCRGEKKGKDKCVTDKERDCHICAGSLKIPHKKKSKSSDKFDDSFFFFFFIVSHICYNHIHNSQCCTLYQTKLEFQTKREFKSNNRTNQHVIQKKKKKLHTICYMVHN